MGGDLRSSGCRTRRCRDRSEFSNLTSSRELDSPNRSCRDHRPSSYLKDDTNSHLTSFEVPYSTEDITRSSFQRSKPDSIQSSAIQAILDPEFADLGHTRSRVERSTEHSTQS